MTPLSRLIFCVDRGKRSQVKNRGESTRCALKSKPDPFSEAHAVLKKDFVLTQWGSTVGSHLQRSDAAIRWQDSRLLSLYRSAGVHALLLENLMVKRFQCRNIVL